MTAYKVNTFQNWLEWFKTGDNAKPKIKHDRKNNR